MTVKEFIKRNLQTVVLLCFLGLLCAGINLDISSELRPDPSQVADRTGVFHLGVGPNASFGALESDEDEDEEGEKSAKAKADDPQKKEQSAQIHLIMVGDMLMHDAVLRSGEADGRYNYDGLFAHVADYVKQTDLAIVNQETILGGKSLGLSGYPCFNSPEELADSEIRSGFNIILHATNHAYDKGKTGIINTINYWEDNYPQIPYLGINKSQTHKDDFLCIYEKDGIRVAILNYTFGINGGSLPNSESYLVDILEEERVRADLKRAAAKVDFVVVCPHWGTEYQLTENSYQKRWTDIFLEEGVDLVLGAHPHVIQPIRWVKRDGKKMLVYYSLGNFVNGTTRTGTDVLQRIIGGMADVTISRGEDGRVQVSDYGVRPLICHYDRKGHYTTYFLEEYTPSLLRKNGYRHQIPGLTIDSCWGYVDQVWGELAPSKNN